MLTSHLFLLRLTNVSDKGVEKIKTHNLFCTIAFAEIRAFYEIM